MLTNFGIMVIYKVETNPKQHIGLYSVKEILEITTTIIKITTVKLNNFQDHPGALDFSRSRC